MKLYAWILGLVLCFNASQAKAVDCVQLISTQTLPQKIDTLMSEKMALEMFQRLSHKTFHLIDTGLLITPSGLEVIYRLYYKRRIQYLPVELRKKAEEKIEDMNFNHITRTHFLKPSLDANYDVHKKTIFQTLPTDLSDSIIDYVYRVEGIERMIQSLALDLDDQGLVQAATKFWHRKLLDTGVRRAQGVFLLLLHNDDLLYMIPDIRHDTVLSAKDKDFAQGILKDAITANTPEEFVKLRQQPKPASPE